MHKQFALFMAQFVHVSAICRCFLNVHSTYVLDPLCNQIKSWGCNWLQERRGGLCLGESLSLGIQDWEAIQDCQFPTSAWYWWTVPIIGRGYWHQFLSALTSREALRGTERELLALPARHGGLGITIPTAVASRHFPAWSLLQPPPSRVHSTTEL